MTTNQLPLTPARWRRLDPALRAELRQILGGPSAILNHQVLDVARALCTMGAYDLALALYLGLEGEPCPIAAAAWGS